MQRTWARLSTLWAFSRCSFTSEASCTSSDRPHPRQLLQLPPTAQLKREPLVLFLGNGPRNVYADVEGIMRNIELAQPSLNLGPKDLLVFGGDTYVENQPDLGVVVKRVQEAYQIPLLAVVGWDDVDSHCNFFFRYSIETCEKTGRKLYGGVNFQEDGSHALLGGSKVYLSPEWLACTRCVVSVEPRGRVGMSELAYVQRQYPEIPVVHIPAPRR